VGKRPHHTERQIIAELRPLEELALGQAIAVASCGGSAGCRVSAETLRCLDATEVHREYNGPKSK
jgi:hypothetical protein